MNLNGVTQEQKRELFDRDRRIEAVVSMLGEALIKQSHDWTDEERNAYGWVMRTLRIDIQSLAA